VSLIPFSLIGASISARTTPNAVNTDFRTFKSLSDALALDLKVKAKSMLERIN